MSGTDLPSYFNKMSVSLITEANLKRFRGINCSSLGRLELQWRQPGLLQYPAYLTNSGDPRYPGVSLRVVIRVLFAEKYVDLVIVRVFLPLHPGRRDERGLWERRTCLPQRFTVYSSVPCQRRTRDEKSLACRSKTNDNQTEKCVQGLTVSGQTDTKQVLKFQKELTATLIQAAFPCLWDFFCPYFGASSHGNTNGNCVFIIHCEQPSVVYPPETQLSYIQTLVLLPAFLLNCNELPSVSNGAAEYRSPSENSRY